MENANEYFNAWAKVQTQALDALREQAERMKSFCQGGSAAAQDNPFDAWQRAAMSAMSAGAAPEALKDTLFKTMAGCSAMQKLYQIWQPLLQAMQDKSLDMEALKGLQDPAALKAAVDHMFNLDAEGMLGMQQQLAQFSGLMTGVNDHFGKPWMDAAMRNMALAPHLAEGKPEVLMQMFHALFQAFDNTAGRFLHVPAVGKDREKVELMARCLDDMAVYAAKNVEYQNTLYLTGMDAMEKVVAALAKKVEAGEQIDRFDDFFDLWVDINEKTFFALFQTRAFSRLKGDLLDAGLNVRAHYFKLTEMQLFDLPIALRSEMDDLYKTLYELRKQVKKLEAQVNAQQVKEPQA